MQVNVRDYYIDKTILITGGTGFIGKVLIEKLLYSCPKLKTIYVIIRKKRNKNTNERLQEMFNKPVFSRVCKEKPDALKKLVAIHGDILEENLGLNNDDYKKLQHEVNIVFHCAATLKLESTLKDAVDMNLTGTQRVVDISLGMTQLDVFVHLSTAFCYADKSELNDNVLDDKFNPQDIMELVKWMPDETLNFVTGKLLRSHPNTYTFTKRLAEILIRDNYPRLPAVVARPSIVIPSCVEPVPGWVDSLNGPMGVMLGAGKGVIRTMHCDPTARAEIIPVDYLANSLIVIPPGVSEEVKRSPQVPVFNLTSHDSKALTWGRIMELSKSTVRKYPFDYPLWYPDGNIHKSRMVHKTSEVLFHWLPAIFIDFLLLLFRKKRFMIRLQTKISDGLNLLEFFTTRKWMFYNNRHINLRNSISEEEKEIFQMDISRIEEEKYMEICILGGRQYCMKEPLSSLPRARVVNNIMYFVDRGVKFGILIYLLWMLYGIFMQDSTKVHNPSILTDL